ncbi:MAG TPA: response regulator [Flavisolibacter sp.]|jgi:DNA-binding NtrC family response regulator|nr:response regulator [Flavisolibacter sp.]
MSHSAKPQPRKVLIVEDEGDMCLLLNIILNGKDLELDHVKNLADAEKYLQNEQPAVVLLDNKLPDGFGIDFIPVIKKNYPDIKVVMISGYDGAAKDVALENGADTYLEKPFSKDQLYKAITSNLSEQQPA